MRKISACVVVSLLLLAGIPAQGTPLHARVWPLAESAALVQCPAGTSVQPGMLMGYWGHCYGPANPIVLDVHCSASSGSTSTTTESCTLSGVTAGDLITASGSCANACEVVSISDSCNSGLYDFVLYNPILTVAPDQPFAIAAKPNSASGNCSVTVTVATSETGVGIHAEAWKNARTSAYVDPASGGITQQQNLTSTANPTAGSTKTPTNANELIYGAVTMGSNTPTAGTNYLLIDSLGSCSTFPTSDCDYPEYWIQTTATATNCPYTASSDNWVDMCTAFLASSNPAGVTPLNGVFVNFEGLTNGSAPTTAQLASSSNGLDASVSTNWQVNNTHSSLTGATAAQCSANLNNSVWVNGTSFSGSGSLGLRYTTGTGGDSVGYTLPGGYNSVSIAYCFTTSIPQTDSSSNAYSLGLIAASGSADYCNPKIAPTGSALNLDLETKEGTASSIALSTNTTYQFQLVYTTGSSGKCQLAIYNTSGTQVGSTLSENINQTTSEPATFVSIGDSGAETQSSGNHMDFDNVQISISGAFPLTH